MWLVATALDGAALREMLQRSSLKGRAGVTNMSTDDIYSAGNDLFFGAGSSGSLIATTT